MDVKLLDKPLTWTTRDKAIQLRRRANLPKHVGIAHGSQCTRIRVRDAPDGTFSAQLNLNDIIDAAVAMLPDDAYALLLLVDCDIHESDEDDFCCGRAYGGSRVAVVQSARYNPSLDLREGIDRAHMWPSSHCKELVDESCAVGKSGGSTAHQSTTRVVKDRAVESSCECGELSARNSHNARRGSSAVVLASRSHRVS
jgi:archaemetzincin